jgi:2-polyprenyl-3-methyl-5-hydroxy-6-metoxy-1,4-benzoquinol methylase
MSLRVRSTAPELMDDPALDMAVYQRCLRDLAAVNRVTFTHAGTLRWLARAMRDLPKDHEISILDVAYGQGDLLRAIAAWGRAQNRKLRLAGIDLNPRSAVAAAAATPAGLEIAYLTADVFGYVPTAPVDFIVTSQFTHHLPDEDILRLLRWLEATARRGWFIMDLQRHAVAYYGFRWLARLCGWHRIVRLDGTVSIARGFTRPAWRALLARAGVEARISWQPVFRFGIGRVK